MATSTVYVMLLYLKMLKQLIFQKRVESKYYISYIWLIKWPDEVLMLLKVKVILSPFVKVTESLPPINNVQTLLLWNSWTTEAKFYLELPGLGTRKFFHAVWVTWPIWSSCWYMVKKSSFFSPELKGRWSWKLVCTIKESSPS